MDIDPPASSPKVPYLHLNQGNGQIYDFPHDATTSALNISEFNWIGTLDCVTCVCVYIPLGVDYLPTLGVGNLSTLGAEKSGKFQCFAAHIDAHAGHHTGHPTMSNWVTQTPEEKATLKSYIRERLTAVLPSLADGGYAHHQLRDQAIIVCPRANLNDTGEEKMQTTGGVIVEAIRDFFCIGSGDLGTSYAHGFVVNPQTNEKRLLQWSDSGMNETKMEQRIKTEHENKLSGAFEEELDQDELWRMIPDNFHFVGGTTSHKPRAWSLKYDRVAKTWALLDSGVGCPDDL